MNRLIIYQYINKLKKEDIVKFIKFKEIQVSDCDIDMIYYYIKNEYKRFFNEPELVLNEIKDKISDNTYLEIMKLYDKYKDKII